MTDNKQPEASELVRRLRSGVPWKAGPHGAILDYAAFNSTCEKAADMIEALSSQQPSPKDEPQRQGGYFVFVPQGIKNHEYLTSQAEFARTLELLEKATPEEVDTHLHCGFSRILDALRIVASRPTTVVDNAAVERAAEALDDAGYITGMLSKDVPINARKAARVALLAAFPQFNKEEKENKNI